MENGLLPQLLMEYAVGGAASRPDSFTGLNPDFARSVYDMTKAAHAAGHPLQITSAYRSPEVQARLYENALKKYGSPEKARKWVAPPGRSQHNKGTAVDYAIDGGLLRDASSPAAMWIKENAGNYGLDVPMSWEPWQVEASGARSGSQPAPAAKPQLGFSMGEGVDDPTPENKWSILQELGKGMEPDAPPPMQLAPRDTSSKLEFSDPMTRLRKLYPFL